MAMGVDMEQAGMTYWVNLANSITPSQFATAHWPSSFGCLHCGNVDSHERFCPVFIRAQATLLAGKIRSSKLEALPRKLRELADECLVKKFA